MYSPLRLMMMDVEEFNEGVTVVGGSNPIMSVQGANKKRQIG